jgi:hypothetical protein
MSDTIPYGFDLDSAVDYNQRRAKALGWYDAIPDHAVSDHPCFFHDPVEGNNEEKRRFALEVLNFQRKAFSDTAEHDGKLGQDTWTRLLQIFDNVDDAESFVLWSGRRFATPEAHVISFEESNGFDLHRAGNFSRRPTDIRLIVLHWGGSTVHNLYRYFNTPERDLSTHFGIGPIGAYQFLDLKHRAWHAGYVNDYAVGVDICQQPTIEYRDYYCRRQDYDVSVVQNPTDRGRTKILSLDVAICDQTCWLVLELCRVLNIPLRAPRGADGLSEDGPIWHGTFDRDVLDSGQFQGVVGHHHVKETKWDMACWWDMIFKGTELS